MFGDMAVQPSDEEANTEAARAAVAHVLRRCGFGPKPGAVAAHVDGGPAALVEELLAKTETWVLNPDDLYADLPGYANGDDDGDVDAVFPLFMSQMISDLNPLHERMTWYWHTHFTSSIDAANGRFVWRQWHLLRTHALGNFAELARSITIDPAMLFWLDGDGSWAEAPNENYAREFLELFTLGRDQGYTEDDVRAAARIFAGWSVDWDNDTVEFEPDGAYNRPLTFMGERRRWTTESLVDFVCSLPQCHRHVARRVYRHLVGTEPSDQRLNELAAVFANANLEIKPLVAAIVRGDDFLHARHTRARQPIEWALGAMQACGFDQPEETGLRIWNLEALGQLPYLPPNVAGWPLDDRWSSASQVIARTGILLDWQLPDETIDQVAPTADAVLDRCGVYEPSEATRQALETIERDVAEFDRRLELLFLATLTSPEFSLL